MIIGIFGQKGHGKSTFARMVQNELAKFGYNYVIVNKPDYKRDSLIVEHGEWLTEALAIRKSKGYNVFVWNDQEIPPNLNDNAGLVIQWLEEQDSTKKQKYEEMFNRYFNYLVKRDHERIMRIHAATVALSVHYMTLLPKKRDLFD
jgi:energy-coupling factor transporter ATP-binding protein EcfA2